MRRFAALFLALAALAGPAGATQQLRRTVVSNEAIKDVPVIAPQGEPKAIVALISDMDGWTPARDAEAAALAKEGAMVIEVDMKRYIAASIATPNQDCVFFSGDIEDFARLAGKTFDLKTYRLPVLLGVGAGGDLAYAMLAQAPANMFSGAVSAPFTGRLAYPKPLCDGPKSTRQEGGDLVLGDDPPEILQGEWRIVTAGAAPQAVKAFADKLDADVVEQPAGGDLAAPARDAAFDIGGGDADAVNALPLVTYEPKTDNPKGLVVFYAGDGGWRDLDKTVAGYMQQEGYGVVGIDTLRYFWNEKSPRELGDDLEAIVARYGTQWKTKRLLLAGYSFGADVIPFAWGHISRQVRSQVQLMALLGLSKTADFEVSVSGWLGVGSGEHDVLKPASQLPMDKVVCVYGKEELEDTDNDVACTTDSIAPQARMELPGGHHYDENYEALARRIDGEFEKRQGLVTGK
jgi:type IV secretory pathway VirJ component